MNNIPHLIILFTCALSLSCAKAQLHLSYYCDAGRNNVSEGLYIKTSLSGIYKYKKNKFETGGCIDIYSNIDNNCPGFFFDYSREFSVKKKAVEIHGFYLYNRFSGFLFESDKGVYLKLYRTHFFCEFGTFFRKYGFTGNGKEKYNIDNDDEVHENFNLMYSFSYFIKPPDHKWNAGVALTNMDHYLINVETNPVFNLQARYNPGNSLVVFAEAWYRSAGAFNLSVSTFGFFFRTGVIWKTGV
ncbi:MAG: hypothetical protein ABIJ16_05020 [Bacteroidota bacterium]